MSTLLILTLLPLVLDSALEMLEWLVRQPVEIFQAYRSLLQWAAESIQSLFEKYGYWVVFFGTLSENTLLVGLIVPGAIVVILAGLAAHDGTISVPLAIVLGIAGTIIGDTLSYLMGRFGWSRFGQSKFLRELSDKVREPLLRKGTMFVLFYHFAGYTRVIGPTAAGLLRMPYRKWALADYGGAVLWVCGYFAIGYLLGIAGLSLDDTESWLRIVEWGLLIALGLWMYFLLQRHTNIFDTLKMPAPREGQDGDDEREAGEAESTDGAVTEEAEPTR